MGCGFGGRVTSNPISGTTRGGEGVPEKDPTHPPTPTIGTPDVQDFLPVDGDRRGVPSSGILREVHESDRPSGTLCVPLRAVHDSGPVGG